MNGICLLPTLNRPKLLAKFFKSYKEAEWVIPGWVLIDKNDYLANKASYESLELPQNWKIIETEGVTMGQKCRELWDQYKDLDWVAILNDDHKIVTKHGDKTVLAHLRPHNIIGTNDGWQAPQRLAGLTVWGGAVIRAVGWLFPKNLNHLYIDSVWEFLGGKSGAIQILMDVLVEHDHAFKSGVKDDTHLKVYPENWDKPHDGNDTQIYQAWLKADSQKDLAKIVALQPKQGLMVATPSHDGNCSMNYALGLTDLAIYLASQNVYFEMARITGSSLIPHARNSLVDMFLNSKCQRLLFVDSDQGYSKEAAILLFQSNRPIIAGVTPHKRFPINLNFEPLTEDRKYFKDLNNKSLEEFSVFIKERADKKGEIEVKKAGSGFLMIDRSVFNVMKPFVDDYYPFDNSTDTVHSEFFSMGSHNKHFRGEDWRFCELAKELKIPIFINVNSLVSHSGIYTWGQVQGAG